MVSDVDEEGVSGDKENETGPQKKKKASCPHEKADL